jgi:DNA polymerase-3 subunit alpha
MFDLWGETTALPMPSLELEPAGVSDREKASWEKELMGIPFSKKLFDPCRVNPSVTLCGAIDNEMIGENITVICEVASVTQLFTRKDNKSFVKATVEDISGGVEVTVWPRVYEGTRELWQEGNLLQLKAMVRIRDDSIQLNVNEAYHYQLPAVQVEEARTEEVVTSQPDEALSIVEETPPEPLPTENHRLVISITQTSDVDSDVGRLRKLNEVIKDFSGEDEVILRVGNGEKVESLKLSNTGYCPALHQQLVELVGEEGLRIETFTP